MRLQGARLNVLPLDRTDAKYKRLRRQVFFAIFVGYAAYYLVRMNLSLAIPGHPARYLGYTKAQLGTAMTALSIAYGVSKFLMGSVSDRSNPRWFMPLGLLLSAAVTASFGLFKGIYAWWTLIILLQALNGWFNGMGWPPCGKTMVHWFSANERGRVVSLWNTAHNIGGGLVAALAAAGVALFGDWGAKFYFNALVAASIAVLVYVLLRDSPQTCGLPLDRGAPQRHAGELLRALRAHARLPRDLLLARAQQPAALGDRRGERVRVLRALRRAELDPDLPPDGEGLFVPRVECGVVHVRVRRDSRARSCAAGCRTASSEVAEARRPSCSWGSRCSAWSCTD